MRKLIPSSSQENFKNIINTFHNARRIGYGKKLPSKLDEDFINHVQTYIDGDEEDREEIRSEIPDDTFLLIIGFSDRMSILADRNKDEKFIFYALMAHSLEGFRFDYRENIYGLTLIYHVAEKIGVDTTIIFKKAADISSPKAAKQFIDFLDRPNELKKIGVMNIIEIQTSDGVDYKYEAKEPISF